MRTPSAPGASVRSDLESFRAFETTTRIEERSIPYFTNEFWPSRQRQAHSLHEISYRACFKPQLPRFFIDRLTEPGDVVYDPFMGRGTTPLEAAFAGRTPIGNDVNPLSAMLVSPRLDPPRLEEIRARLGEIDWSGGEETPEELGVFYHLETLREIAALRAHLAGRRLDRADAWIRMVALNRLTGHSPGFFSVYTLPPNQAASARAQRKINSDRGQRPPRRVVPDLILKKSRALLSDCDEATRATLCSARERAQFPTGPARSTPEIADRSVRLVVTSPPFLDVVDYAGDNWLRCWFAGIDPTQVPITMEKSLDGWSAAMGKVFTELERVLAPGGWIAFEVGEVRGGRVRLDEHVLPLAREAGLAPWGVVLNQQQFTKTANCWGVSNNTKGTNTNRIVLIRKG